MRCVERGWRRLKLLTFSGGRSRRWPRTFFADWGHDHFHALQQAWIEEQVPQCGHCQSGQILATAALLTAIPRPTDADIDSATVGSPCHCGTFEAAPELTGHSLQLP